MTEELLLLLLLLPVSLILETPPNDKDEAILANSPPQLLLTEVSIRERSTTQSLGERGRSRSTDTIHFLLLCPVESDETRMHRRHFDMYFAMSPPGRAMHQYTYNHMSQEVRQVMALINAMAPPPPQVQQEPSGQGTTGQAAEAAALMEVASEPSAEDVRPTETVTTPPPTQQSTSTADSPDIDTTLAGQLAEATVTSSTTTPPQSPPYNSTSSTQQVSPVAVLATSSSSGQRQPAVIVSDIAPQSPGQRQPAVIVSDIVPQSPGQRQPAVIVSDIVPQSPGQRQPAVIVSDIPDAGARSPSPPTAMIEGDLDEDDFIEAQMLMHYGVESNPPPPRQSHKRKAEDVDEETGGASSSKKENLEADDQATLAKKLADLIRKHKPDDVTLPPTLEQQIRSLNRSKILSLHKTLRRAEDTRKFDYYGYPIRPLHRESSSDEETDEGAHRGAPLPPPPATFQLTNEQRLLRYLIFGGVNTAFRGSNSTDNAEGPAGFTELINQMIGAGEGDQVVSILKDASVGGRSTKQDTLLCALAKCCRNEDMKTKQAAYAAVQAICRIPTHLFQLVKFIEEAGQSSGWGRGLRAVVCRWYNAAAANPRTLAMHVTKYMNRHGWKHRDLFRLAHIKPVNDAIGFIVRYAVKGMKEAEDEFLEDGYLGRTNLETVHKYLKAVEEVKRCTDEKRVIELVQEHDLVREHLNTEMLNKAAIWSVLLEKMPLTALLRNLNKMTSVKVFDDAEKVELVRSKLLNMNALRKARVHPLKILSASTIYAQGYGDKGSLVWMPNPGIKNLLEEAFYASFQAVEPTNKRILIALDISASMNIPMNEMNITVRQASTAMCLVTVRTEPHCDIVGFHHRLIPLEIFRDPNKTLGQLVEETDRLGFGSTDCSKPITWALKHRKEYDAFIIYTDSETNCHKIPPYHALLHYRQAMNKPSAKLIVVGMKTNNVTVADPNDMHMLDIVGFDPDTPELIRDFLMGEIQ
ncbi:RNA-binding protein Ro60-like isoform X3 [Babylonia areolata]|uniref:RNA-binding protein Ro60-like isoform X3 n=1 Tax=Babylonia areolata TaxID=304850 RepID=UPI003FD29ED4